MIEVKLLYQIKIEYYNIGMFYVIVMVNTQKLYEIYTKGNEKRKCVIIKNQLNTKEVKGGIRDKKLKTYRKQYNGKSKLFSISNYIKCKRD